MNLRLARTLLATSVLALALVSIAGAPGATRAQGAGIYIALGDSIAAGVGSSLPRERSYPAIVAAWMKQSQRAPIAFENLAVPGETAATFLANGQAQRFRDTVARARTAGIPIRAVTVTLGGNEMLALDSAGLSDRQAGLDAFSQHFREAVRAVREQVGGDVPIVVTTYYDPSDGDAGLRYTDAWWIDQFNTVIRDVAAEHQASVADIAPLFRGHVSDYTHEPFDVHPTNEGYRAIARAVWAALAIDQRPPNVEVLSGTTVTRRTPTLRIRATDDTEIATVKVSDESAIAGPFQIRDDEYAVLLDLGDTATGEMTIEIEVTDVAGHSTRREVTMQIANPTEGES